MAIKSFKICSLKYQKGTSSSCKDYKLLIINSNVSKRKLFSNISDNLECLISLGNKLFLKKFYKINFAQFGKLINSQTK